jgi:hypothetical protein
MVSIAKKFLSRLGAVRCRPPITELEGNYTRTLGMGAVTASSASLRPSPNK